MADKPKPKPKPKKKIPVLTATIGVTAYGEGASINASFTTATVEDGEKLAAAIEHLIKREEPE